MRSNQGHTSSAQQIENNPISLTFFISPAMRSLTSADYCANPLTTKHHHFRNRDPPPPPPPPKQKRKSPPSEASFNLSPVKLPGTQLKPQNNQTDRKLTFLPAAKKSPQASTKLFLSIKLIFE